MESESRRFINKLAKIIKNKINVNIVPVYKSFKIGRYFQLKSDTPLALCLNAVYKFTCSCDINLTYYGMSTRHLITRVREHLDFNSIQRSAIAHMLVFAGESVKFCCINIDLNKPDCVSTTFKLSI